MQRQWRLRLQSLFRKKTEGVTHCMEIMESLGFVVVDDWIVYDICFFSVNAHAPYMYTKSSCLPCRYCNDDIAPLAEFLVALDAAKVAEQQAIFEWRGSITSANILEPTQALGRLVFASNCLLVFLLNVCSSCNDPSTSVLAD